MRLSELKAGESATILKVTGHGGFRRRIMEMGFVRGQRVEVILNAPLKDPIEYKIMGYDISLRRSEADMVVVLSDSEASEYLAGGGSHHHHTNITAGTADAAPTDSPRSRNTRRPQRPAPKRAARRSTKSSTVTAARSACRWWATPTAARPRFSTPFRAVTNTSAITAASRSAPRAGPAAPAATVAK